MIESKMFECGAFRTHNFIMFQISKKEKSFLLNELYKEKNLFKLFNLFNLILNVE